jgi:hypothetical protein
MRGPVLGGLGVLAVALCVAGGSARPLAQPGGEPALPGEWVSQRPPAEVFTAARETLLALGFRLEREAARTGILMTRRRDYDAGWPDGPALDLAATQTPDSARLYLRTRPTPPAAGRWRRRRDRDGVVPASGVHRPWTADAV